MLAETVGMDVRDYEKGGVMDVALAPHSHDPHSSQIVGEKKGRGEMGYLTDDDLKAMLTKAAEYKKSEADRIRAKITEARAHAERLEADLKRWEALIPAVVWEEMQEDEWRKAWEIERRKEQEYRDRAKAEDVAGQRSAERMHYGLAAGVVGFVLGWSLGLLFG
jgi:F0F1-type ATP synthase assembly protein I